MTTRSINTQNPFIKASSFFFSTPKLSKETEKALEILKSDFPTSYAQTVIIPKTARTIPQTLGSLQAAKETQEQEKTLNCLKIAGAIALQCAQMVVWPYADSYFMQSSNDQRASLEESLQKQADQETAILSNISYNPQDYIKAATRLKDNLLLQKNLLNKKIDANEQSRTVIQGWKKQVADYDTAIIELQNVLQFFQKMDQASYFL